MMMIGYSNGGYRLYDGKKIVIARNVVFNEVILNQPTMSSSPAENLVPEKPPSLKPSPKPEFVRTDCAVPDDEGGGSNADGCHSEDEDEFETPPLTVRRYPVRVNRNQKPRRLGSEFETALALSAMSWIEDEPLHYGDVFGRVDEAEWRKAIENEIQSLNENETWEIVASPKTFKLLGTRWVFKLKDEPGGKRKYKARLVARGFQQKEGIDFHETYAPVARLPTVRLILAMSAQFGLETRHLDVTTAFLYGHLKETVYLKTPDGVDIPEGHAIKLKRSLYGLKQSPRCWNDRFNVFIINLGFKRSQADYCLYSWQKGELVVFLIIYVDDMLLVGNATDFMKNIVTKLSREFKMKDLGPVERFMGLNIHVSRDVVKIDQIHYIDKILLKFGMAECKPIGTPMEVSLKLQPGTNYESNLPYRELIGSLMYLAMGSRPDLSFSVGYLSRFQEGASATHFKHLKRILRYLQQTKSLLLKYERDVDSTPISCYVDAD